MSKIQDIYNGIHDARDLIRQQHHLIEQYRGMLYRICLDNPSVSIDTREFESVPTSIEFRMDIGVVLMKDLAGIISSPFENYIEKYEDLMK